MALLMLAEAGARAEPAATAAVDSAAGPAGVTRASGHAPQPRVTAGVVAGLGLADMSGEVQVDALGMQSSPSPQVHEGLSAGAYAALQLDARWGVRLELRYTQRGASAVQAPALEMPGDMPGDEPPDDGAFALPYEFDLRLAYLELPLLATFTIPYDGRLAPYFFAGPDLGLLLSAEVSGAVPVLDGEGNPQLDDEGLPVTAEVSRDVEDGVGSFDLGITFGAGMKFPLARGRMVLDARYTLGVIEAADGGTIALIDNVITLSPRSMRHRVLSLSAAYEF